MKKYQRILNSRTFLFKGQLIRLHDKSEFKSMRRAGLLAARTLDYIRDFIRPGISTDVLNDLCHNFIVKYGAIPAPLYYRSFPKSVCTSINNVVCHGIPSKKEILREGDNINIDVTTIVDGWYGDTSRTFHVGEVNEKKKELVDVAFEAMMCGIKEIKPKATLGDIGFSIKSYVESKGFSIVKDFCGHGIGKSFHTSPDVLSFGSQGHGLVLREGMFFTVEPIVNAGDSKVRVLDDGWTVVTSDGTSSAQFEHSVGVTSSGYEIFTESKNSNM